MGVKTCNACHESKELSEFHNNQFARDGKAFKCKSCAKKHRKKNYKDNKVNGQEKKWKEGWHVRNPEMQAIYARRRTERISQNTPPWADMAAINEIYRKAFKMRAEGLNVVVDHIIPLRGELVSGLHVPENLQIIGRFSNAEKSNKYEVK